MGIKRGGHSFPWKDEGKGLRKIGLKGVDTHQGGLLSAVLPEHERNLWSFQWRVNNKLHFKKCLNDLSFFCLKSFLNCDFQTDLRIID